MHKNVRTAMLSVTGLALALGTVTATAAAAETQGVAGQGPGYTSTAAATPAKPEGKVVKPGQSVGAHPATAAQIASCPAGELCVYEGYNFDGKAASFATGSPDLRAQGVNDLISSYINNSDKEFTLWEGLNYDPAGQSFPVWVGETGNMETDYAAFNDITSSISS